MAVVKKADFLFGMLGQIEDTAAAASPQADFPGHEFHSDFMTSPATMVFQSFFTGRGGVSQMVVAASTAPGTSSSPGTGVFSHGERNEPYRLSLHPPRSDLTTSATAG